MSYKKTLSKARSSSNKKPLRKLSTGLSHHKSRRAKLIKQKLKLARPLHKRILLHPLSLMLVLCVGVAIIGTTYKVVADSVTVSAEILAPPLSQGAVITNPVNGQTFTTSPIVVSGTCPLNSYVNLYRNGTFSGVAWCSSNNTFQITTDLFIGLNTLVAQDYNTTNQAGPTTPSVSVTYSPPSTSPTFKESIPTSHNGVLSAIAPLLLTSDYHFQTFEINTPFSWKVDLEGGVSPFAIQIVWGDGQTSTMALKNDQIFDISHVYQQPGYYPVIINATDGQNAQASLQIAALIKAPGEASIFGPNTTNATTTPPSLLTQIKNWLWVVWPAYITILLMLFSFWLGERQEVRKIFRTQGSTWQSSGRGK